MRFAIRVALCAGCSSFAVSLPHCRIRPTISNRSRAPAKRWMEHLGRGLVAMYEGDGKVFVSWRLLGTDPDDIAFHLYRKSGDAEAVRMTKAPLNTATSYRDTGVDLAKAVSYFVRPVANGEEGEASAGFTLPANAPVRSYLRVPLKTQPGHRPNDAAVGDLDGDGEYEIIVKQDDAARRDNSQGGTTDEPILEAYKLDGTLLWRINLGKNIREGAHYTQFLVYDLDGDGRAEVVCKTADGTVDGTGK